MTIEQGTLRQVALATLDDPGTAHKFLIRDDAFHKSSAVFARTHRMDQPLNVGPGSGWRQLSWEGGHGQFTWRDEMMYHSGSADVFSRTGKIRMWPGWDAVKKDATRTFDSYAMAKGGNGAAFQEARLYFAERSRWTAATPSGGFDAFYYSASTDTVTTLAQTPNTLTTRGYTAICPATDDGSASSFIFFGTANGLWVYNETGDTWTQDTGYASGKQVQYDSMVCFKDALYYCAGKGFFKRTPLPPYGVIGTHTQLKDHKAAANTMGLAVWNNRLWYGVQYHGNRVSICTSDGVTAAEAFVMPEEFVITGLHAHYGALYIFGGKPQADPGTAAHPASIGEVWRYTGSSLVKLWDSNDEEMGAIQDGRAHVVMEGCSWGTLLAWGVSGWGTGPENRPGVMFYDPDKDALFEGPQLPTDPDGMRNHGTLVTGLCAWDNTLAIGFRDNHSYVPQGAVGVDRPKGLMVWRQNDLVRNRANRKDADDFKGRSIEHPAQVLRQFVLSSRYHGEESVATEEKVWLSLRLLVKVPSRWCKVKVYAVTNTAGWRPPVSGTEIAQDESGEVNHSNPNDSPQGVLLDTIEYDADHTGFYTVTIPVKAFGTGSYLRSEQIQYAVVLENTNGGNNLNTDMPEVDAVETAYIVAPDVRFQWRLRFVLADDQELLDGSANALTTQLAQSLVLTSFWSSREPFTFYQPTVDNSLGASAEVVPVDEGFAFTEYRLDTETTELGQEVTLTLIQNVTS